MHSTIQKQFKIMLKVLRYLIPLLVKLASTLAEIHDRKVERRKKHLDDLENLQFSESEEAKDAPPFGGVR